LPERRAPLLAHEASYFAASARMASLLRKSMTAGDGQLPRRPVPALYNAKPA
jgi:hypothetical protein